jgi:C_GCAxxG_C_C family probable redox protein
MNRSEAAIKKFEEGYNCAQAVLYSFCDDLKLDVNTALKISCGFGGGMGRRQEVCGAVSGGVMAIGMLYGRGENEDRSYTENTYQKVRDFMDKFSEKHNTCICRELLNGCSLLTPEGREEYREKDLVNKVCKQCIRDAAEIIGQIAR